MWTDFYVDTPHLIDLNWSFVFLTRYASNLNIINENLSISFEHLLNNDCNTYTMHLIEKETHLKTFLYLKLYAG